MITNPLNLVSHAKAMLVEQIMALIGRSSPNPKRYREILEGYELQTLARTLRNLEERISSDRFRSDGEHTDLLLLLEISAPELTTACEEPQRIQSTDGQARETLILKPTPP